MLNKQQKEQQQYASPTSINGNYEIGLGKQIIELSPDKGGNRSLFDNVCVNDNMQRRNRSGGYRINFD